MMSTLKSINVQHPSSATTNIVNDASGNVTVGNNLTVAGAASITGNVSGTWNGTAISAAKGGTGLTTLTANNVLLGNGTSAVQFVAPGTSGNVLTSNGTTWASSAPASTASLTLLATLTTTSGTTQSATGLATTYTNLIIIYQGVANSTGSDAMLIAASSTNGAAYGTTIYAANSSPAYGAGFIWLANSNSINHPATNTIRTSPVDPQNILPTTTAAPINALRFNWATGYTFNAGTIYIYGWN